MSALIDTAKLEAEYNERAKRLDTWAKYRKQAQARIQETRSLLANAREAVKSLELALAHAESDCASTSLGDFWT